MCSKIRGLQRNLFLASDVGVIVLVCLRSLLLGTEWVLQLEGYDYWALQTILSLEKLSTVYIYSHFSNNFNFNKLFLNILKFTRVSYFPAAFLSLQKYDQWLPSRSDAIRLCFMIHYLMADGIELRPQLPLTATLGGEGPPSEWGLEHAHIIIMYV